MKSKSRVDGNRSLKLIRNINISVLLLVGLYNTITGLLLKEDLMHYIIYAAVYCAIAVIILYLPLKITGYTFLFMGLYFTSIGNLDNPTGIIFFVYGFYILKNIIPMIVTGVIVLIIGVVKYTFVDATLSQLAKMLIAYVYIFTIYYILIHPKSDNKITVICPELDSETIKILQNLYEGCSVKEAAVMLYLSEAAVSKRIGRAKKAMNAKTTAHLLAICQEKGYIRLKVDNSALR